MESLFARQRPKKGWVFLMLGGSLLVHGGLVGIGALMVQPEPPIIYVDWQVPEDDGSPPPPVKVTDPVEQPTMVDGPTATPDVIDLSVPTPPSVPDDTTFAEPASPTPRLKIAVKPVAPTRANTVHTPSSASGMLGNGALGSTGASRSAGVATWVMPHPPYPAAIRRLVSAGGLTTVRITTDATGRVSSVVIVRSTGNPMLDAHTVSYVRENWRGPANASRTTEFLYQLR